MTAAPADVVLPPGQRSCPGVVIEALSGGGQHGFGQEQRLFGVVGDRTGGQARAPPDDR